MSKLSIAMEFPDSVCILLIKVRILEAQFSIFTKNILKWGGKTVATLTSDTTHIVTSLNYDELLRHLKFKSIPEHIHIVSSHWLIDQCLQHKPLPETEYVVSRRLVTNVSSQPVTLRDKPNIVSNTNTNPSPAVRSAPANVETDAYRKRTASNGDGGEQQVIDVDADDGADGDTGIGIPYVGFKCCDVFPSVVAVQSQDMIDRACQGTVYVKGKCYCCPVCRRRQSIYEVNKGIPTDRMSKYRCAQGPPTACINASLADSLIQMGKKRKTGPGENNQFHARAYERAATTIKHVPYLITTEEQVDEIADRPHSNIGDKIRDKIKEFIREGRNVELSMTTERERVVTMLIKIWGTGRVTAERWYDVMHCHTLQDVIDKGHPTGQQLIGIKYFDEFNTRIPREEVTLIIHEVRRRLFSIDPMFTVIGVGSYRRGKPTCGDVDLLFTHDNPDVLCNALNVLIKRLQNDDILTDILTMSDDAANMQGVCLLTPGSMHRRIDVWAVPADQWAFWLVSRTGDSDFSRSMRAAAHELGWSLNDRGIFHRDNHTGASLISCDTERDVFDAFKMPYKEPEERNLESC